MLLLHRIVPFLLIGAALACPANAQAPDAPKKAKPPRPSALDELAAMSPMPVQESDSRLQELLKRRYNAALAAFEELTELYLTQSAAAEQLLPTATRVVKAKMEATDGAEKQLNLLRLLVEIHERIEHETAERVDLGVTPRRTLFRVRYERLDAEIRLLRAERRLSGGQDAEDGQKKE